MFRMLFVIALAVFAVACSRTATLRDPSPAMANPNAEITRGAIYQGLNQGGWVAEQERPGKILARLNVRTHMIKVFIVYDAKSVRILYADSNNMKHEARGQSALIHKAYMEWTGELMSQIQQALRTGKRYPTPRMPGTKPAAPAPSPTAAPAAPVDEPVVVKPAAQQPQPGPVAPKGPAQPAQPAP